VALTIPVDPLFLHPTRLVAETLASRHPWITSPHSDLPGKAAHVALVASALSQTSTPFRGRLPILDPLLSQPIVELSLRMPSWWWCRDGRDRSVARRAYESRLPAAIIGRVTKGGPDAFCRRLLEREAASVADLLLDGLLAKHQIIDRAAVEAVLGANHDHTPREDARLLQLCDAEAWARHWTGAGA
jgi:asparagine synthase (glutamine-hydrolysing)